MRFVGMDVHKRVVEVALVDEVGNVVGRARLPCERNVLEAFATNQLRPDDQVALEATTNTWAVVDIIEPHVGEVVVSNPMRTRAIAEAKVKTDKVDSEVLAQLLRCGYLPRVWTPDANTRALRHVTSRRAALVADRTRQKNRIHAVLHQRLITAPVEKLFSKTGLAWLGKLDLDDLGRRALDSELRLLEHVEEELAAVDQQLAGLAYERGQAKLLMTLPGVDVAVALSVLAVLGDVDRFRDGDHAASYLGLVPSTRQSAGHCYHGPITKQGKGHARWMLVQAAQHVADHPGPLGVFFRRLAKKKGRNVAVVATARKLVVIAWHMLKNNEPYRYATPKATEAKLSRLRVKATGKRRRGGLGKGAGRHPHYGTGQRTRAVPSLDQVLAAEQLPPAKPLSDGERRTVRAAEAEELVRDIHRAHRVARRSKEDGTT